MHDGILDARHVFVLYKIAHCCFSYRIAQAAVLEAIPKLHELSIPTKRPNDYYAEMIKTDAHMVKVSLGYFKMVDHAF